MPAEVYLMMDVNAWVAERGGFMGIGSRRVMAIGLPLMTALTVDQVRAVIAHEFGHYRGGDTSLGRWVYKTREAVVRTMRNMVDEAGKTTHVGLIFIYYGKFFLRVTQAISRQQEFAADALAARVVTPRALAGGLKRTHFAALAFRSFMQSEYNPVLGAGRRAPLTEGFAQFITLPQVVEGIDTAVAHEIGFAQKNPYDSHPPLQQRIAALGSPNDHPHHAESAAATLLDNLPVLESRLLTHAFGGKAAQLAPIAWEQIGVEVLLPYWARQVEKFAHELSPIRVRDLPAVCRDTRRLDIPDPEGAGAMDSNQRAAWKIAVLQGALCVILRDRGWAVNHAVGENITLALGESELVPSDALHALATGEFSPEDWSTWCAEAGIGHLYLATG